MAAANTDKWRKKRSNFSTTLSSGVNNSVATIPLTSVSGLATDTAVTLTINRVDADGEPTPSLMERITGVVSSNDIATALRGQDNTSAKSHSAGAVVEELWEGDTWNDAVDSFLVSHNQDGTLKSLTDQVLITPMITTSIDDANGNEVIKITATGSAVNEITIANAATGNAPVISATGGDTDIDLTLTAKGAGKTNISNNDLNLVETDANIQVNDVDPWRTITLMPGFLKPTTTAGAGAAETVEAGTNDIDYDVLPFDASTDESAFANFQMPDSWDAGVIQFRYIWTNAGGGAAETVEFELAGRSYANDDAIDQAVGTAVAVSDTWIAQGDIHISAWSGDVTLAGTPGAGELVHLEITRDVSDDNLTGDARLIAVQIRWKQAQFTD